MKSELEKTNWRIFKVSGAERVEDQLQFSAELPPQDIAYLVVKKSEELKIKFDAIVTLSELTTPEESTF